MAKVNMNPGASYTAVVTASQYDVGRVLTMEMYEGNSPKTFESGTTVKMVGTKPSGLGFTLDGSISGSTVTVITTATMTDESGSIPAELRFKLNGTDIGSANVTFSVEASPHPEGTTDGDTETARDLMTRATEAMLGAEAAADDAEASAQSAAASAEAAAQAGLDTTGSENGQVPTADGQGGWSWQDQQGGGGGGGTSDDITNASTVTGSTVSDALETLSGEIANKGTYSKPSGGIPKTDLASAVQTSLGKADTALQTAPVTSVNGVTGAVVIANATTSAAGLMSATDKSHLDTVFADYSSALTALGV